jgi:hypothetical protein
MSSLAASGKNMTPDARLNYPSMKEGDFYALLHNSAFHFNEMPHCTRALHGLTPRFLPVFES